MNITAAELKEITSTQPVTCVPLHENMGQNIIVLDRGFVYVGNVVRTGDSYTATECKNIRRWGTTKGLGELVGGSLPGTSVDAVGKIIFRSNVLNHLIPSTWTL